jgi:sporulation protein YlmC with PRC-barrel domain
MMKKFLLAGLLASTIVIPALAQNAKPAAPAASETKATHTDMWRSSKLIGVNVYNDKNEKLGDINEILLDKTGKVDGIVIGVGGFLSMGEHDIKVEMNKLKFVDEPMRNAATPAKSDNTTGSNANNNTAKTARDPWYPDHAVLNGATKESLKALTQFKY